MRHFLLASQDLMRYSAFCPGLFKLELQNTNPPVVPGPPQLSDQSSVPFVPVLPFSVYATGTQGAGTFNLFFSSCI